MNNNTGKQMKISSNFDAGNIEVIKADLPQDIHLKIKNDNHSNFYQWFYYKLSGAKDQLCAMTIENAAGAAYPDGWEGYQAVASYDREHWFRVSTLYKDGQIIIQHVPETDCIYYAYFAPYSMERHNDLIAQACESEQVTLEVLGETLDGQDMDLLVIGQDSPEKKKIWVIARQHPGESMAEWFVEGFLDRLLDEDEALSQALLEKAVFYVIPNMNPDGSKRGHLRTNAVGSNLNREWQNPTLEKSPEVFYTRNKMDETTIDIVLDVHGDEALPYNFIAAFEGNKEPNAHKLGLATEFQRELMRVNPDFQMTHGYPVEEAGTADMRVATNQLAERYDAVAMTLEMPFKDTIESPNEITGWSPSRAKKLGQSALHAFMHIIDDV